MQLSAVFGVLLFALARGAIYDHAFNLPTFTYDYVIVGGESVSVCC
jgi:hypothetical protein